MTPVPTNPGRLHRPILTPDPDDRRAVSAWLAAATLASTPLATAFGESFAALRRRAAATLGDVTLGAVGNRVVSAASERFPFIEQIDDDILTGATGKLEEAAKAIPPDEQARAFGFILLEFLTVVGNLTAGVLTPALLEELPRATEEATLDRAKDPKGTRR